jgi:hypothetical protein
VERADTEPPSQRDRHVASIQTDGKLKWQTANGYRKRAVVETAMGRYKGIIARRLRARSFPAQQTEAAIGVAILNQMIACARPKSVRCKTTTQATKSTTPSKNKLSPPTDPRTKAYM